MSNVVKLRVSCLLKNKPFKSGNGSGSQETMTSDRHRVEATKTMKAQEEIRALWRMDDVVLHSTLRFLHAAATLFPYCVITFLLIMGSKKLGIHS